MTKTNFTFFHPMSWMKMRKGGILSLFLLFSFLLGTSALDAQTPPSIPNPFLPKLVEEGEAVKTVLKEWYTQNAIITANPDDSDPAILLAIDRRQTASAFLRLVKDRNFGVQHALALLNQPDVADGLPAGSDMRNAELRYRDWNNGNFNSYVESLIDLIKE